MQYIPGSSVTLSATLSYLQRNQPLPDDSEVQTYIPQICVDYLSHEWEEEDVWKSWRNMTRHKTEIANGVRLENASWRTWWKQRNKLKTISPETLNWLKDSDVTWLYGPLHTAAQPVPPPKQSTAEERLNLVKATGKKPILKHRTITELLNLHAHEHGHPSVPAAVGSPALEAVSMDFASPIEEDGSRSDSPRPPLPHTKSDSHIVRRASASGRDSPPRVTLMEPATTTPADPGASRSLSPAGSEGLAGSGSTVSLNAVPARRHISFNTFVEQYIAIDDPTADKQRTPAQRRGAFYDSDEDGLEDDEDEDDESSASSILEMHPTQVVGVRRPDQRGTTPVLRSNSTSQERERFTIAPIPPTSLKAAEDLPAPSPQVVYAPPKEFLWDQSDFNSSSSPSSGESTSSSDNLSNASGSITGQNADMGFVAPQWGRPPVAPGTVGKGTTGPVGPAGVFQADPYVASGYEEPAKPEVSTSTPVSHLGLHAGRTKWVPGSEIPDDPDDVEEDSGEEAAENSTTGDEGDEEDKPASRDLNNTTNASSSVSGSTTSSSANRTVVAGSPPLVASPPSTVRSTSSRGSSSQPARGILKNAGSVGGSVTGGDDLNSSSSGVARPSNPIGIPKTSISHPPPSSAMHMPPTATMSTSSPPSSNMLASAGFLSPTQESVIFFGGGGNGPSPGGRGRTSTRSASSSGISDRSRSSSKISGTSSPLGSVSPSGYGSPSGSRANSVLGNRRSSTDVGAVVGPGGGGGSRGLRRENGNGVGVSARQSSTSPPVISSPLATNSLPASSLGTIVANVPMDSVLVGVMPERGGPPLSRSGIIANARMGVSASTPRPRMGSRNSSSSSVTSTASSGSSGETASAMRTPREEVKMVLPAAPAAAVSAPLPVEAVKKPATSSLVLPEGPRPTVIISPHSNASGPSAQSSGSRDSTSAGTSMSMDARDSKLEEEMRKVKAAQPSSLPAGKPPETTCAPFKNEEISDPEEVESGTFREYKSTPTPSNSPVMGLSSHPLGSRKQGQLDSDSVPSRSPPSPSSSSAAANNSVSPATTPKRGSFVLQPSKVVSPGTAVITPPSTSAAALTPTEESGIVGMAANSLVSSAKGMLGAIWSLGGESAKQ